MMTAIGPIARRLALSLSKGIVFAALAVGGVVALLLLAAHLPRMQARVATWAASKLEARGISIRTRVLTFNLATRRVHIEGLVASTTTDSPHPFLEADSIDVTLPRSVYGGRLAISSLRGDGVRVLLVRRQDGSTNVPRDQSGASGGSSSFPIDTLTLSNASVEWRDDVLGMGAVANAVSVNLDRGRGTVALGRPARVRAGNHETSVIAGSQIAWNGATLSFDSLRLQAPEVTLSAAGSVGVLAAGHLLTLEGNGSADLDRLGQWFALSPRPLGHVAFRVHAAGSAADPRADVTVTSPNLACQGLTGVSIDGAMHVDRNALDVGRVSVRALGGAATGSGRVSFAAGGERARVAFEWQNIDAAKLLAAFGTRTPVTVDARLDGRATASADAWTADALTGDLAATTRTAPQTQQTSRRLGLGGTVTLAARAGAWRATFDQWIDGAVHVEGRADGRLAIASLAASPVTATVVATADSLPELWRTLHKVDLAPGAPPATLPGGVRADLTLSGRMDNPRLGGRVDATLPALDRLQAHAPSNLAPSGGLGLSAAVSGTVRAPAINGRLLGEALSIAGQHADSLEASFGLTPQLARIEPLVLTQAGGRLTVNGQYDLRTRAGTALVAASNMMVSPVPGTQPGETLVPINGRLSGEVQVEDTVADPHGSGQLVLEDTRVLERGIGRVSTRLTLAGHQLQAAVALADLFTTGTATLALASSATAAAGSFVIDTQTTDADLAMLASRMRVAVNAPMTGQTSFAAHVEGVRDDLAHARTTVTLQRLEASVGDVPVRASEPGRASYDGVTLGLGPNGRSQLRAAGRLGPDSPGTLVASLDGRPAISSSSCWSSLLPEVSLLACRSTAASVWTHGHRARSIGRPSPPR